MKKKGIDFNGHIGKELKSSMFNLNLNEGKWLWNNGNIIKTTAQISREDWWRRWLYSTNAKDILRHWSLFCYIIWYRINQFLCYKIIYPVSDLDYIEKQDGLFGLCKFNVFCMEAPMNRIVKLSMKKKFYKTCRTFKRETWAQANHCLKIGTLARRFVPRESRGGGILNPLPLGGGWGFLILNLQRHYVGIFIDVVNSRSLYVSIPLQMTSHTLCIINILIILYKKLVKYIIINNKVILNQNKFKMETSEKGMNKYFVFYVINLFMLFMPSVAIFMYKNIELYHIIDTSNEQRLALYLEQFICRQNGGRITDQAKVWMKIQDSGNYKFSNIKRHSLSEYDKQQNSVLLKSIYNNFPRRNLSYYTREKNKNFRKDKILQNIVWPEKWQGIEEEVRKDQMKLCILAEKYNRTDRKEILSYQRKLALKLNFRLLAVKIVTSNKGKNTAGIDGKVINDNEEKCQMVGKLRDWIINPEKYKVKPVKRVFIPKGNNKWRPLGIPSIEDRCLQALLNLVLEPLIEMKSDIHSYGYRKFRSAKMAIGALRVNLISSEDHYDKYVLDADIKGFFDNISHEWIMNKIPLEITLKIILEKWLKAGAIYLDKFEPTVMGTPQGSIISPTLANFTLNGLQEHVRAAVIKKYKGFKNETFNIKYKEDGKNKYIPLRLKIFTVRYADDFIVIGRSSRMIKNTVIPAVKDFLKERGLSLSDEKTKVLSIRNSDKIKFLGYCFQYQRKFSQKYNLFNDRINQEGIACYPQRENYIKKVRELRVIFRKSLNDSAYSLITKLNPIIRGWANYFNMSQSYYLRNRLNYALYRYIWLWVKKKYPKWGKKRIAKQFFLKSKWQGKTKEGEVQNMYYTGNDKKWIFRGFTKKSSIYNEFSEGKYIELLDPTLIVETISARRYRIPKFMETVHAYHPDYKKLIEFNQSLALESVKNTKTLKIKLLKKQKGRCAMCKEYLLETENSMEINYEGRWHIHHKMERALGGSKSKRENMELVHAHCHISHHKER